MSNVITEVPGRLRTPIAVIGSGPGGAITACLLAEAGRDVLLIEEGPFLQLDSCPPFSRAEMVQKYRNGGITVAMGRTKVAYVEGRCVGGGSEINSGLYHRTPPDILEEWRREFQVAALEETDLEAHFRASEQELCVSQLPGPAPPASRKLHEGAERLGWKSLEVPRWFRYDKSENSPTGVKQSMTKTYIPRLLAGNGKLLPSTRVHRLVRSANGWFLQAVSTSGGRPQAFEVEAGTVFVCCGAIQTPALLRRSGIRRNIGQSLHCHPTVKVVARFPEAINDPQMGVPVHQVKEFAPRYSFGCSISSLPYLALALAEHPGQLREVDTNWQRMAIYYAMIRGGRGTVRPLPFYRDPLVRYRFEPRDLADLGEALRNLCRCLFASGAELLIPSIVGQEPLRSEGDLAGLPEALPAGRTNLMTIHLFSSCPMGENRQRCAANSFGQVHDVPGLYIADASLLPGPPGVNPQGSIMALARRNVQRFLQG